MGQSVDDLARIVWGYHLLHQKLEPSDVIFVLGSHDTRVADRAIELHQSGYGDILLFSGGFGRLTSGTFAKAEADIFADIALKSGIPPEKILVENQSSNTGENIMFSRQLLEARNIKHGRMILVQKPYMERRTYATFMRQWPDPRPFMSVTSPVLGFEDYCNKDFPKDMVINIMVGDLQRIIEYPKLGFQIEQPVPTDVLEAYDELRNRGYTKELLSL